MFFLVGVADAVSVFFILFLLGWTCIDPSFTCSRIPVFALLCCVTAGWRDWAWGKTEMPPVGLMRILLFFYLMMAFGAMYELSTLVLRF